MRYIILPALFIMMVSIAQAEVYQWTDRDDGIHFTDNPDKIPPAYRSKAREVVITPSIQIMEEPPAAAAPAEESGAAGNYGGHDETWWRASFKSLRDQIKGIQDNLQRKKENLVELRRMRTLFMGRENRIDFNEMEGAIKKDEEQEIALRNSLTELDNEASKYGVPLEWRRD